MKKELLNTLESIEVLKHYTSPIKSKDRKIVKHIKIQEVIIGYIKESLYAIKELFGKKAYRDIDVYFNTLNVVDNIASTYIYANLDIINKYKVSFKDEDVERIKQLHNSYIDIKEDTNTLFKRMMKSQKLLNPKIIFRLHCLKELIEQDYQNESDIKFKSSYELLKYIEDKVGKKYEDCKDYYDVILFYRLPVDEIEKWRRDLKDAMIKKFLPIVKEFKI